jgi:hypothetical protein
MKKVFALTVAVSGLVASGLAQGQSCPTIPAGAAALGYTTQVFYDTPTLNEVSATDTDTTSKWYPGSVGHNTGQNLATRELLSTVNSELAINLGGSVISESQAAKAGAIPWLSGGAGFYIEFAMRMSTNDADHFAGLYLETAEHNGAKADHLASDPAGFERWTEIDVSETGYGPGSLATVINWWGIYPLYSHTTLNSYGHDAALDFTVEHRYGLSWNPATNTLQWYIDDVPSYKISPPNSVIKDFHYYAVMEASSHGANHPYQMYIHYVRAYSK